ncbi:YceI family protein [Algoriphagus jejuensis]
MKLIKQTGLFVAAGLLAFACGAPNNTVETSEAQEVASGQGNTYTINAASSTFGWRGYKPAGEHFGTIPATQGTVTLAGDSITAGSFTFDIPGLKIEDMPAEDENYGKLYGHLQSPDFFDAASHPTATFEITAVEPFQSGDIVADKDERASEHTPKHDTELAPANPTHWISGNLTMRGTTKNIKFPATVSVENGTVSAKAGFNIDRTEWGLTYGNEADPANIAKDQFIYNTVSVVLDVTASE